MQNHRVPWRKHQKTRRFRRLRRRFRAKHRKNTRRVERTATFRPDTNAPKRQRGPRKHRISSRFRLDIFVLFLFFIPFAPHEPAKPSTMYCHDSPPRCGREQYITQATEPRDFASTTSKHLKAISRHKISPMTCHDFMDTITVFLTPCAPGRNVALCSLRVFALFCTEAKPLFSKTSCFLAFSSTAPPLPRKTMQKHASNAQPRPAKTQNG